jgi:hypothetical protein
VNNKEAKGMFKKLMNDLKAKMALDGLDGEVTLPSDFSVMLQFMSNKNMREQVHQKIDKQMERLRTATDAGYTFAKLFELNLKN